MYIIIYVGIESFNKFTSSGIARSVPIKPVKVKSLLYINVSYLKKNLNSLIFKKTVHRRPPSLEARILLFNKPLNWPLRPRPDVAYHLFKMDKKFIRQHKFTVI